MLCSSNQVSTMIFGRELLNGVTPVAVPELLARAEWDQWQEGLGILFGSAGSPKDQRLERPPPRSRKERVRE